MSGREAAQPIFAHEISGLQNSALRGPETLEPLVADVGSVDRCRLVRKQDGTFHVLVVDQLSKPRRYANKRPGKLAPEFNTWAPERLLRSAFAYEDAYERCSDKAIWQSAAEVATASGLSGNQARYLAIGVLSLLAIRNGMEAPTAFETI